jgi:hypothetical protein
MSPNLAQLRPPSASAFPPLLGPKRTSVGEYEPIPRRVRCQRTGALFVYGTSAQRCAPRDAVFLMMTVEARLSGGFQPVLLARDARRSTTPKIITTPRAIKSR